MKFCPGKLILLASLIPSLLQASTSYIQKGSSGWSILQVVDGVDPADSDSDFNSTWYHPTAGGYVGGAYDGPAFTDNQPSPFHYGGVDGLSGGTTLPTPPSGSRYTTYFYKVFDAGAGSDSFKISLLADDGAFVYLNGQLIATEGVSDPDTYTQLSALGNEATYDELALIGDVTLQPGLNLLAVSIHQVNTTSSDMGFDLELVEKTSETLVTADSGDWAILSAIDPASNGYDPVVGHSSQAGDPDFNDTWKNQSFGGYSGAAYDGPGFTTGQQGPFAYGGVDGLPSPNTELPTPNSGTRKTAYFIKEFDGGIKGFDKATFTILADDGAFIYLNGNLVGVTGNLPNDATQDTWDTFTSGAGSETAFQTITATGDGVIQPGTNLLAVSLHQHSTTSSDLGFSLELAGAQIGAPVVERGPYLQSGSHDRMTLRWRTSDPSNSVVHFGDSPTNLTQTITVEGSVTDHVVTLTGLNPATQYYYQIESSNNSGTVTAGGQSDFYFKTYPIPGAQVPTRLWVIGDSGTRTSDQANVYNAYRNRTGTRHTDAWLMLGDNAYNSGTDSEFQGALFDAYPELLRNTTMWSCIGNHETYTNGGEPYLDIHSFPTAGECGGVASGSEHYYSYDHGNIHFVCLDSATANVSDLPGNGGMIDWLAADLQATDKDWIIAYFHHGPYTKGSHNSDTEGPHISVRNYITPLLEDYGVDLVLSGHSHTYERSMLVNGHHSNMSTSDSRSGTFDYNLHVIDNGNGSQTGSIDGNGNFITDGGDGAYRKELGSTQSGTIYSVCGASGKLSGWANASTATVNPDPHPVFVVNLRTLGSMIINVDGDTLNAQYLDDNNVVRDDFTIVKPASGSVQVASVSQFDSVGVAITTVTANGSGTLAYSIIEGNEDGKFEIDGETGVIRSLAPFDYQADKIYNLTIGVSDDGVPVSPVLVTVNVTLDPPVTNAQPVLNDTAFSIAENSGVSTTVGTVTGTDPDIDDTLTYSIVAGNTGSTFEINTSTGEITTATILDFETTPSYTLTVVVMDDGTPQESDTASITIQLGDVNEAPILADSTGGVGEVDQPYAGNIGGAGSDPDAGDTLTYGVVSGPIWLAIAPDGTLSGTPGSENIGDNLWTVRVTDSADNTADAHLEITITANNPPIANDALLSVPENSAIGTSVGTVVATDADAGDVLIYGITGGNPAGAFSINSNTGELTSAEPLDFEATARYVLTVTVTDDGSPALSDTASITIDLGDVNEAPSLANSTGGDGEVDQPYAGSIGGSGSDPEAGDTLTYGKVDGPTWLAIESDGTLSGTPANEDVGINSWEVRVTDSGDRFADATLEITVAAAPSGPISVSASGETTSKGTILGGDLASTTSSNNIYETLEEEISGKGRRQRSQLDHQWTFSNVPGGSSATLRVKAYHTVNSENDHFVFSYSTDGSTFTNLPLTVSKTSADDEEQTALLPSNPSGTVFVRVTDTDNSQGNSFADSLYVDLLTIDVTPLSGPPLAAGNPSPANGADGTTLNPILTWSAGGGATSYQVSFGTTLPEAAQGSQTDTSFEPGGLLPWTTYFWRVNSINSNGTTTGTVWNFTTGAETTTLFSDDFEGGNLDGWATTGNVSAHSSAANSGIYGARFRGAAEMIITVNTTEFTSVNLKYDRSTSQFEANETLDVHWSLDGSIWNLIESTNATSWGEAMDHTLPDPAAGQPALQIRFKTNASSKREYGYLDNVIITGS